jgi:hypothetical protein
MATNIAIPSYESSLPATKSANAPKKKQVIIMQSEEKFIDYLGIGKHNRSELNDARSSRFASTVFIARQ